MESSIAVGFISMFAFAGVILTDMVMRGGIYDRPSQPLAISCATNALLAIPAICYFGFGTAPAGAVLLALGSGLMIAVANGLYFKLMFSPAGETTEISCFDAMAPWVVMVSTMFWPTADSLMPRQIFGILLAPAAILLLHLWGEKFALTSWKYRAGLLGFAVLNGFHLVLIDRAEEWAEMYHAALGTPDAKHAGFAGVFPFYWIGMSAGVLILLSKTERTAFAERLPVFLKGWKAILVVEALATLAFAAEIYAFHDAHPAVISQVVGTFAIPIFLGGIALRRWFGYGEDKFPVVRRPLRKLFVVCLIIAAVAMATWK